MMMVVAGMVLIAHLKTYPMQKGFWLSSLFAENSWGLGGDCELKGGDWSGFEHERKNSGLDCGGDDGAGRGFICRNAGIGGFESGEFGGVDAGERDDGELGGADCAVSAVSDKAGSGAAGGGDGGGVCADSGWGGGAPGGAVIGRRSQVSESRPGAPRFAVGRAGCARRSGPGRGSLRGACGV